MTRFWLTACALLLGAGLAQAATPAMSFAQAAEAACKDEVEPDALKAMIDQCIEVSPATHPPCNGENSCDMIADEIKRGCAMLGNDAPAFCAEYTEE